MRQYALLFLSLLMAAPALMFGQTAAGTLTGVVTDPSGAVIANVSVVATHVDTGTKIIGTTTDTGNYTIPQLPVGRYEVTVTQQGFKTFHRENVTIAAAQTLRVDVGLELGAATESVTVTAETTLLQSDTGALVHNINPQQFQELPVLVIGSFFRDPLSVMLSLAGSVSGGTGFGPVINGISNANNQYKVDGEPITNVGLNTDTNRTNVSADSIQEVAVQTSNFNAEFGSVSGGLFNIVIKSGTNQLHGTGYDYIANDEFNASDPAAHTSNRVRRNDYGFNVGGPIIVPKLYNGKNKTFFFFNWEQYRDFEKFGPAITPVPTVPIAPYRTGDFSSLPGDTGNTLLQINGHNYQDPFGNTITLGTIFDPRSTQLNVPCNTALTKDCSAGQLLTVRSPFPNNMVPPTLIDPVSMAILNKYVPLPQGPNAAAGILTANYYNPFPASRIQRSPSVKADHSLGAKARIGFTWTDNHSVVPIQTANPGASSEGFPEPITSNSGTFQGAPTFRVNLDYNITPTMLFHLGLGYQIFDFCACPVTLNYNPATDIGLTGVATSGSFPLMASTIQSTPPLGGLKGLSTAGATRNLERHPSTSGNLTWIHGKHTVKLGADARQDQLVVPVVSDATGSFAFGGTTATAVSGNGVTWQPSLNGLAGFTGNSNDVGFPFANWLLGSVTSLTIAAPAEYRKTKQQYGLFIQDTWRVRRNLTLDYGIRWDYGTYAREDYGRVADFSPTTPNPAAGGRLGAYIYEATCGCQFAKNYPYGVGPRFGVAYTIDKKTVFRGGVGVAYDQTQFTAGGIINSVTTPTLTNGFQAFTLGGGVPSTYSPSWPNFGPSFTFTPGTVNTNAATFVDPQAGRPDRVYQWNATLQREITRNLVLEAAYVGNEDIWAPTAGFQNFNAISPALLQDYGFTIGNISDEQLLNTNLKSLSAAQLSTLASRGIVLPYTGFPTSGIFSSTVIQEIKNFPQFSSALSPTAPQGRSWYDALQLTLIKRLSHGLSANVNYTFQKNLSWTSSPDIYNLSNGKDVAAGTPPQVLKITFEYRTPRYKGSLPVLKNKLVSSVLSDWNLSSALYYQTAAYLGRPASNGTADPISLWLGRGPGNASLNRNPDGSFMNPWSVDWYDLNGVHHTTPLDINCHCFNPATTIVLNPAAWSTIPNATWTADTSTYTFFRGQRHPSESMNFGRSWTIKERYSFQVRIEFNNVFNRIQLGSPSFGTGSTNPTYTCAIAGGTCNASGNNGGYISGFGTFGNTANAGTYGTPRTGQLVGRFTF